MPVLENANTVTVGSICFSCQNFYTQECPYKNYERAKSLSFKGDIRGKCIYFTSLAVATNKTMRKKAELLSDTELNLELYKMITALSKPDREVLLDYWVNYYQNAPQYAKDMVTDTVETGGRNINPKGLKPGKKEKPKENKFPEPFKVKKEN